MYLVYYYTVVIESDPFSGTLFVGGSPRMVTWY
jgi:hypothetical protein